MNFDFTPEQHRLREEIRAWLQREVPEEMQRTAQSEAESREMFEMGRALEKRMARDGWLVVGWPREYGGGGFGFTEQAIVNEAKAYYRAYSPNFTGLYTFGPALMHFGTDDQKKKFLPLIAKAEVMFCQGFSEPNAGSDLAALQTRAERRGDAYVISGQKLWTSNAHWADYCYLAARTNPDAPKHKGISLFVVPMNAPGITIRPVRMMGMGRNNEVFFDNVVVPAESLIGEENRGWYHAAATLDFERSGLSGAASSQRLLDDFIAFCKDVPPSGKPLIDRPGVRYKLAEMQIAVTAHSLIGWRIVALQEEGRIPTHEISMGVWFGREVARRNADIMMSIIGPYGTLDKRSKYAPLLGNIQHACLTNRAHHGGGTSDIQRVVIAHRGLGLPR
jgi:alkylation response protein AidB-like acyl-CoA dehydrogenase